MSEHFIISCSTKPNAARLTYPGRPFQDGHESCRSNSRQIRCCWSFQFTVHPLSPSAFAPLDLSFGTDFLVYESGASQSCRLLVIKDP